MEREIEERIERVEMDSIWNRIGNILWRIEMARIGIIY